MGKWILAFLAVPVIDLYLLVRLGEAFGGQLALLMALAGAVLGVTLARTSAWPRLRGWQTQLAQGRAPGQSMLDALLLLLACVWFIVPGILSDVLAALLLVPALRRQVAARVTENVLGAIERGMLRVNVQGYSPVSRRASEPEDVIDVEGEEVRPEAPSGGARSRLSS